LGTLAERYRGPADLPQRIPFFPLRGAILLPRARLPLNVFEPRYLAMLDDVMSTSRVLGIVQPVSADSDESPAGKTAGLRRVGCVGRVTAYQELDDGRIAIAALATGMAQGRPQPVRQHAGGRPGRSLDHAASVRWNPSSSWVTRGSR
jgi:ATP-dependent Lon protease